MRPGEHGPHETLHDRWKRWSDMGVLAWITTGPVAEDPNDETIPIDATCPEAHRTASSLRAKEGGAVARSVGRRAAWTLARQAMPASPRGARLHAVTDAVGRPIRFLVTAGGVSD